MEIIKAEAPQQAPEAPALTLTPQETEDVFIGSGALSYAWWENAAITHNSVSWIMDVTIDGRWAIVTHETVMTAIKAIAKDGHGADSYVINECQHLLTHGPEDVDFDADMADQVLQVAVLDIVTFA